MQNVWRTMHGPRDRKKRFWTAEDEMEYLIHRWGHHSIRAKTAHFWHGHEVQLILIALLLIDVIIVFVELFVDAEFPMCSMIQRDAVNCCPACLSGRMMAEVDEFGGVARMLSASGSGSSMGSGSGSASGSGSSMGLDSGSGSGGHGICDPHYVPFNDGTVGCDPHLYPGVHVLHEILFYISVFILAVFEVELFSLLAVLDVRFFLNPFFTVDLIVVTLSLVLEISLYSIQSSTSSSSIDATQFLIIMRVWRMARVGHGIAASSYELADKKLHALEVALRELEAELYKVAPGVMKVEVDTLVYEIEEEIEEIDEQIHEAEEREVAEASMPGRRATLGHARR